MILKRKREQKETKSKKPSNRSVRKIKRTTQNAITYEAMMQDGICYLGDDLYSASIQFTDVNYQIARQEDQESIWLKYMEILNSLGTETGIQLLIHNHQVDKEDFEEQIMMKDKGDEFDEDRRNFNRVIKNNLSKGTNNIKTDKMFIFTSKNENIDEAKKDLQYQTQEFQEKFKELGCNVNVMNGKDRLEQIYTIFNPGGKFFFDYSNVNPTFITKDAIAPTSFNFSKKDSFEIDNRFCRVLWLKNYSTEMSDKFINDLTRIEHNLVISFHMKTFPREDEIPMIKTNIASMEMQKMEEQRKALKDGYDPEMIPAELKYSLESAYELLEDIQRRNQRLFICQFFVMINAENEIELEEITKKVLTRAKKHSTEMIALNYQQERCMNACLPLGKTDVYAGPGGKGRTLTTPVCGAMIPFTSQELMQPSASSCYYGMNPTTNNLIFTSRKLLPNASGWYLAKPRSGKSFAVKREIVQLLLNTDDDIIVIDPENEYEELCCRYKGTNNKVDSQSKMYFNLLEGDITDPVFISEKADFMQSFMANILGYDVLEAKQKSVVDRSLRITFATYEQALNEYKQKIQDGLTIEPPPFPTLDDFAIVLKGQPEKTAQDMYESLGIYIKDGTYNMFSKTSTDNIYNRFTNFAIKDLSEGLKSLAMMVILETLWVRVKKNFLEGKRTWIYIDEIYLLFFNRYCVEFFYILWKRAPKYGAILTGITQNVEDLIHDEKIRTMLANSNFIVMLDQASTDRDELADILNLSNQMLSSITNAKRGSGLMLCGNAIIPFKDDFPKNNPIYEVLTSDFDERTAIRKKMENLNV
ncbi:VirB4-like conjugal transfer ATPase, CD1110 family [Thomasclavelia cocleata]|uniref:VirB4-like conjugal transfer ATPase, CD1110 family n=1 Tax=Thomasclavelia cocleata TaxID=69824 RepID=UPI0024950728|nr:hypothetical protein [Thomasclavelia cocleata]